MANQCRDPKHFLCVDAEPVEPPPDEQLHASRHCSFSHSELFPEISRRIVEPILFIKMPEQFLDENRFPPVAP